MIWDYPSSPDYRGCGDGLLTLDEFTAIVRSADPSASASKISRMFTAALQDGSDVLTPQDFIRVTEDFGLLHFDLRTYTIRASEDHGDRGGSADGRHHGVSGGGGGRGRSRTGSTTHVPSDEGVAEAEAAAARLQEEEERNNAFQFIEETWLQSRATTLGRIRQLEEARVHPNVLKDIKLQLKKFEGLLETRIQHTETRNALHKLMRKIEKETESISDDVEETSIYEDDEEE